MKFTLDRTERIGLLVILISLAATGFFLWQILSNTP